jgi:hypothetical protein
MTSPPNHSERRIEAADYVLIAEIVEIQRWQEQATELVQHLADDLGHLVKSRDARRGARPLIAKASKGR